MKALQFSFLLLFLVSLNGSAQNISVVAEQGLKLGTFYITGTSSGSVSVNSTGSWSASSNIHSVNSTHSAAVFTLSTDSTEPINVQVDQPGAYLMNSKGDKLFLETTYASPQTVSIQQGVPAQMHLGGTLTVDAQAAPGDYTGELFVTFSIHNE